MSSGYDHHFELAISEISALVSRKAAELDQLPDTGCFDNDPHPTRLALAHHVAGHIISNAIPSGVCVAHSVKAALPISIEQITKRIAYERSPARKEQAL